MEEIPGNQKLAMSGNGKEVLIETRGEGGYALVAPSAGYSLQQGKLEQMPVISLDERNLLAWVASVFDERPPKTQKASMPDDSSERPGDVFNKKASWDPLLQEDGWTFVRQIGDRGHYTRPGKQGGSTSATLHPEKGLFVFSTGTQLPSETPLSHFGYLAHFRFAGDFSAAARWVRETYSEDFPTTAANHKEAGAKNYRLTELGNAERFRDQHGEAVRYVSNWKKWIFYDGKSWKIGADDKIRRMAHATVKSLYAEAAQAADNDMAQKIAKWAAQSCKSNSISAMLREAAALLSIDASVLDADPWLFNCQNCTIDLKSGKVRPHNRSDWLTKRSPVEFDPQAKAPRFEKVLNKCFSRNQELIGFVQRFAGYCLSGSTREQCIFIWWAVALMASQLF